MSPSPLRRSLKNHADHRVVIHSQSPAKKICAVTAVLLRSLFNEGDEFVAIRAFADFGAAMELIGIELESRAVRAAT